MHCTWSGEARSNTFQVQNVQLVAIFLFYKIKNFADVVVGLSVNLNHFSFDTSVSSLQNSEEV